MTHAHNKFSFARLGNWAALFAALMTLACATSARAQTCTATGCTGYASVITGTNNAETLTGTSADECIIGLGGADTITGGAGNDCIIAGDGDDDVNGNGGSDIIFGGAGIDTLTAGGGVVADTIDGGPGNDTLNGGGGTDNLFGGDGNDTINGNGGADFIGGGPGDDMLNGGGGNDEISGGGGSDTIDGGNGTDICSNNACETPTPAVVSRVRAGRSESGPWLRWETAAQVGTVGFEVYRESAGSLTKLHTGVLPAVLEAPLGQYELTGLASGNGRYWIADTDTHAKRTLHGPFIIRNHDSEVGGKGFRFFSEPLARTLPYRFPVARAPNLPGGTTTEVGAALRVSVASNGMLRVSATQLAATLGLTESEVRARIAAGTLAVSRGRNAVHYRASEDGQAIEWYGRASDSIYSSTRAYTIAAASGVSMARRSVPAAERDSAHAFLEVAHAEQNVFAGTIVSPDPASDYWFWKVLSASAANAGHDLPATLHAVAETQPNASLTVQLYGATTSGAAAEHQVRLFLNGVSLGSAVFEGIGAVERTFSVGPGVLVEGANTVRLERDGPGSAASSVVYVQSFDIRYARQYRALDNALEFASEGHAELSVEGFTSSQIKLFDITEPDAPVELSGFGVESDGAGGYELRFVPTEGRRYLASGAQPAAATRVAADFASDLSGTKHAADYLMIAPRSMFGALSPLLALRKAQALRTELVDVQDIYDEFSEGNQDPNGIRAFIAHAAANWQAAPRYVVLTGSGHYDFRGYSTNEPSFIPPLMRRGIGGLYPADSQFTDIRGDDGIADIALGRLPARSHDELVSVVSKLVAYETAASAPGFDRVLMLADQRSTQEVFEADSMAARSAVPGLLAVTPLFHADYADVATLRSALFRELAAGASVLNYFGHGGVTKLGKSTDILLSSDLESLTQNDGPLPLFTSMTCMTGSYAFPGYEALAPALVRTADKGAVAAWAATGQVIDGSSRTLLTHFFESILHHDVALGDAIQAALAKELSEYPELGGHYETLALYALFGDPAMHLRISRPAPPPEVTADAGPNMADAGSSDGVDLGEPDGDQNGAGVTGDDSDEAATSTNGKAAASCSARHGSQPSLHWALILLLAVPRLRRRARSA